MARLSPRDNLLSLLRRQGYETAPCDLDFCPSQKEAFARHLAAAGEPTGTTLGGHFGFDLFPLGYLPYPAPRPRPEPVDWNVYFRHAPLAPDAFVNPVWGIGHEHGSEAAFHMTRMRHPMEKFDSVGEFEAYPWPDFGDDALDAAALAEHAAKCHAKGLAVWGGMACTIWETAWYLRSMENLMMDMASDDPMAGYLLDRVTEQSVHLARRMTKAGADLICIGDDIGMQSRPMMSMDLYREWIKPRLARVIAAARAVNPDIIIDYHSCGYVLPFIDDLIEVGVDVLNPIQPESMSFAEIHARWGDRLSFRGTLGTQTTFPFGTPDEVRKTVRDNLSLAGAKGGLWCTPTHMVEPEVPWENILAYVDACRSFRS